MPPLPKIGFPPPLVQQSRLPDALNTPPVITQVPLLAGGWMIGGTGIGPSQFMATMIAASTVGTTDGGGGLTIAYPAPFKSAIMTVIATPGDDAANLGMVRVQMGNAGTNLAGFHVQCLTAAGAVIASLAVRINWLAVGN